MVREFTPLWAPGAPRVGSGHRSFHTHRQAISTLKTHVFRPSLTAGGCLIAYRHYYLKVY
ncbi:hypothetical protein IBTHAUMO2_360002 [Nitrosopumilaceae archaeon]|nr:hypothetical protein IBTHAUMO2_360002 [Nitrosopumilaceae archaeon]